MAFECMDDCIHLKACRRVQIIGRTHRLLVPRYCTEDCTAYEPAKSHGKWEYTQWWEGIDEVWCYECSECSYKTVDGECYNLPNFCPNCGADMRETNDD